MSRINMGSDGRWQSMIHRLVNVGKQKGSLRRSSSQKSSSSKADSTRRSVTLSAAQSTQSDLCKPEEKRSRRDSMARAAFSQWRHMTQSTSQIRGFWQNNFEYMFSSIGFCVGLGNLWRFPGVVYANGGAAFLIPYTIMQVLVGLPLYILESAIGQFSAKGPIKLWALNKSARGVGFANAAASLYQSVTYNVVMAYVLYYMFASMQTPLPWTQCKKEWVKQKCYHPYAKNSFPKCNQSSLTHGEACKCSGKIGDDFNTSNVCFRQGISYENLTKESTSFYCRHLLICTNDTKTPADFYFHETVTRRSDVASLTDLGDPIWFLAYCLLLSWLIVMVILIRGIRFVGKVAYVTVTLPYVVLTCLFVTEISVPGALSGIEYYVIPNWNKLIHFHVWHEAFEQMLFSLGLGLGALSTLASYNNYHTSLFTLAAVQPYTLHYLQYIKAYNNCRDTDFF